MSYQIVENDVRLLRRILVAKQYDYDASAKVIADYLRGKGLNFVLPEYQSPEMKLKYLKTLPTKECALAAEFGFVILLDYGEAIFLNSEWRNPKTLYVRLVERVPVLGELGEICWTPEKEKFPDLEAWAQVYLNKRESLNKKPGRFDKVRGWLGL